MTKQTSTTKEKPTKGRAKKTQTQEKRKKAAGRGQKGGRGGRGRGGKGGKAATKKAKPTVTNRVVETIVTGKSLALFISMLIFFA